MNELALLQEMRSDIPLLASTREEEATFLARLAEQAPAPSRRPRLHLPRPGVAIGAIAIAAVVGAAALVALPATRRPITSTKPLTLHELAYRASMAALRAAPVAPGQWVYRRYAFYGGAGLADPHGVHQTQVIWSTADGSRQAAWVTDVHSGVRRLSYAGWITPMISYRQLSRLRIAPRQFDAYVQRFAVGQYGSHPSAGDRDELAFQQAGVMLGHYVLSPQRMAWLYRAIASVPGVRLDAHARTATGRRGVGFELAGPPGSGVKLEEIVLDPTTYSYIGSFSVDYGNRRWRIPANNTEATTVLAQAYVSGPGVRP